MSLEDRMSSLQGCETVREEQISLKNSSLKGLERMKVAKKIWGWSDETIDRYVKVSREDIKKNDKLIERCNKKIKEMKK